MADGLEVGLSVISSMHSQRPKEQPKYQIETPAPGVGTERQPFVLLDGTYMIFRRRPNVSHLYSIPPEPKTAGSEEPEPEPIPDDVAVAAELEAIANQTPTQGDHPVVIDDIVRIAESPKSTLINVGISLEELKARVRAAKAQQKTTANDNYLLPPTSDEDSQPIYAAEVATSTQGNLDDEFSFEGIELPSRIPPPDPDGESSSSVRLIEGDIMAHNVEIMAALNKEQDARDVSVLNAEYSTIWKMYGTNPENNPKYASLQSGFEDQIAAQLENIRPKKD